MTEKRTASHLNDAWIEVDKTDDPSFFVRFLDASRVRALEFARANPAVAFAHLALKPGLSLLDCGCGTGDMLTIMAKLTCPGKAHGGDLSEAMIREARKRAETEDAVNVTFDKMDVQSLPFADQSMDRVMATQLLIHVPDPRKAIHEMCRVVAPDGRVAVSDMDWDGLAVGCSNNELARQFTRMFSNGVRNPVVVREYAGWLRAEGFVNIQTIPVPVVFDQWSFFKEWVVGPSVAEFISQGSMSREDADEFLQDLEQRNIVGSFFAASTMYTVTGQRSDSIPGQK
jgi:ubiquinone/menaquinone biosynthesis C-methylase UbiE